MAKGTHITLQAWFPTTSISRASDFVAEAFGIVQKHRGENFLVTLIGPTDGVTTEGLRNGEGKDGSGNAEQRVGRSGSGGGNDRRDDRREGGSGDAPERRGAAGDAPERRDGDGDAEPAKRGRGRPRKQPEASGPPAEGSERRDDRGDDRRPERAEGRRDNEPERTDTRRGEGDGEGSRRSGSDERGRDADGRDREARRVVSDDDGWDDDRVPAGDLDVEGEDFHAKTPGDTEWPDRLTPDPVDKSTITELLGEHLRATGSNDRAITLDLVEKITKERRISDVDPRDYRMLAKALLKDAARYKYGLKKPGK